LAAKGDAHTAACAQHSQEAEELNASIGSKDLRLKSFKDQDRSLLEDGAAKLAALRDAALAAADK